LEFEEETWKTLIKYFSHGILFSGIFLILGIVWAIILAILVSVGLFIGFIIGVIVLFFIIGGINVFLTDYIWNISVKEDWKSLLAHGFLLFILLLLVNIPSIIIRLIDKSLVTSIVLFLIYCFIDGYISKTVALNWEEG
jgi:hypothetical protein